MSVRGLTVTHDRPGRNSIVIVGDATVFVNTANSAGSKIQEQPSTEAGLRLNSRLRSRIICSPADAIDGWRRKRLVEYFDGVTDTFPKALVRSQEGAQT
jgi:hypothetical protein